MPPKTPIYQNPLLAVLRGGKQAVQPTVQFGVPTTSPTMPATQFNTAQTTTPTRTPIQPIQAQTPQQLPGLQSRIPVNPLDIIRQGKEQVIRAPLAGEAVPPKERGIVASALFGNRKDKAFLRDMQSRGVNPDFFSTWGTEGFFSFLGRDKDEQRNRLADTLISKGIEPDRAIKIAWNELEKRDTSLTKMSEDLRSGDDTRRKRAIENLDKLDLTTQEKVAIGLQRAGQAAGSALELADFATAGTLKPVRRAATEALRKGTADDIVLENMARLKANPLRVSPDDFTRFDDLARQMKRRALTPDEMAEAKAIVERVDGRLPSPEVGAMDIRRVETPAPKTPAEAKASGMSFDEWVKGQGEVALHGTKAQFDEFSIDKLGTNTQAPSASQGFFFTDTPALARHYANKFRQFSSSENMQKLKKENPGLVNSLRYFITGKDGNIESAGNLIGLDAIPDNVTSKEKLLSHIKETSEVKINKIKQSGDKAQADRLSTALDKYLTLVNEIDFDVSPVTGEIKEVLLTYKNPLILNDKGGRTLYKEGTNDIYETSFNQALIKAKEDGFDAVLINNTKDPVEGNVKVVFDPSQIKTRAQLKAEWDSAPTPNKKLQAFRDGTPSSEGGYIRNPLAETPASKGVDNQAVSLPRTVAQKTPARIKIDAEIGDIRKSLKNRDLNTQKIGELETRLSILEDSTPDVKLLKQIGGKQYEQGSSLTEVKVAAARLRAESDFIKTINRTDAEAILKNPKNYSARQVEAARVTRRAGLDDIVREFGYETVEEADSAIQQFNRVRQDIAEMRSELREVKGERALSNKVAKVVSASTAERRGDVRFLQDKYGLNDSDIKKITAGRDIRMMGADEYGSFIGKMEQKSVEKADTRQAKIELMDLLERRNFQREEAYRKVAGYPPVSQMTAKQMREYASALENYQVGDTFLTERQLQVVDRSDLAGIKTLREAKEKLLEKMRQKPGFENTTLADLQVTPKAIDNITYDTALAEKNPFYNHLVTRTQEHMVAGEAHFLEVQNKVLDLAKKARASRERGVLGGARQMFVPKHDEIIRYLEAPVDQKNTFVKALTKEELDYANYVQQYYSEAYDHLVKIKELYGSRYVDQYFTHIRRDFLEAWTDDGFVKAMKEWWQSQKENQMIANIIDQDTGNILPKSKFFQYTLQRTGEITPSKNLTRVFLQYAKTFERKKMFDSMIPELDIYTQSLSPTNLTPNGLEMDRKLKTFVNEYLNNKKGRRINFSGLVPQNGFADIGLRMGNTLVSVVDLGLSFIAQSAATVGEMVATYQALGKTGTAVALKRRVWDTGLKRLGDKNAGKILKQAEPFIGRNIWTELAEIDTPIMERGVKLVFGGFSQATVEANKLFLLGSLSKAEMASGVISPARMAELRLAAGRWRDMGGDVKSIVGATSLGGMLTKYKGWAIPIARTNIKNLETLAKNLSKGKFRETITSKELMETYRMVELSTAVVMIGMYVNSQQDDDSFVGKLKARAYMEAGTLLAGIDPVTFLSTPRLITFTQQLAKNLRSIALLETHETDSQWGEAGDLKGIKGLQRQFTPATIRQFQSTTPSTGDKDLDEALKQQSQSKQEAEQSFTNLMQELEAMAPAQRRERLMQEDEATINQVIAELEKQDKPTVSKEQERTDKAIQRLGVTNGARAQYVYTKMSQMPVAERRQYMLDLLERGVISENVVNQVIELVEKGDIIEQ
jgi:hypothetical protein